MICPYRRTGSPAAMGRTATLWPAGMRSAVVTPSATSTPECNVARASTTPSSGCRRITGGGAMSCLLGQKGPGGSPLDPAKGRALGTLYLVCLGRALLGPFKGLIGPAPSKPNRWIAKPLLGVAGTTLAFLSQDATSPAALRVAATSERAMRAIRPLSLAMVTKRKPM